MEIKLFPGWEALAAPGAKEAQEEAAPPEAHWVAAEAAAWAGRVVRVETAAPTLVLLVVAACTTKAGPVSATQPWPVTWRPVARLLHPARAAPAAAAGLAVRVAWEAVF